MIPFTSNQRNIRSPTPKLKKISLIKNPPIHHPVLGSTDTNIKMNTVLNGWNNIPRRGKIFIAKNIYQHRFDPDGVAPHLNKIFYNHQIPLGLIKSSKK